MGEGILLWKDKFDTDRYRQTSSVNYLGRKLNWSTNSLLVFTPIKTVDSLYISLYPSNVRLDSFRMSFKFLQTIPLIFETVLQYLQKRSVYSQLSVPLQNMLLTVIISGSRPLVVPTSKGKRHTVSFWATFSGTELAVFQREKIPFFQFPFTHSVFPHFAQTIVVKCFWECADLPSAFHNNSWCKFGGSGFGK